MLLYISIILMIPVSMLEFFAQSLLFLMSSPRIFSFSIQANRSLSGVPYFEFLPLVHGSL